MKAVRVKDLRLLPAAVVVWVAAAVLVGLGSVWSTLVALLAVAAAVAAWRHPTVTVPFVCLAAIAIGCALRIHAIERSPILALANSHAGGVAEFTLRAEPHGFTQRGQASAVVEVVIRRLTARSHTTRTRARATCFVRGSVAGWHVGRTIVARVSLAPPESSDDVATCSVRSWQFGQRAHWWWRAGDLVRSGVRAAAGADHPSGQDAAAQLVPALVTGADEGLPDANVEDFRRAGLSHLVAVSGTNVTIVLGMVLLLARRLTRSRRIQLAAALLAIIAFVLIARPEPSVQRAAVMGAVGVAAIGSGSRDASRALSWSVLVLVTVDPWLARQAGFILSVCATAGIVWLGPLFAERLGRWLPRRLAQGLAVPLAAQVTTLPGVVAVSGQMSLASIGANLIAEPLVAPATVLGLIGGLASTIWAPLGRPLGTVAVVCAWGITRVARAAAPMEGASVSWSHGPWWAVILAVAVGAGLLWVVSRPLPAIGLALGLTAAMMHPPRSGWPPENLVMVACDVGQGDGTVLPAAPHEAVVVDVGEDAAKIDRCLRRLGIRRVRLLVFTHSDADHVAGWAGAVRGRRVDAVLVGPSGGPAVPGVPRYQAHAGDRIAIGAVALETIWPTEHHISEEPNDVSIVMRATIRDVRVLLAADAGEQAQDALLRTDPDVSADVLKEAHHGSADQSERFLTAVGPKLATISVGAHNDYGHPTRTALDELARHGVVVRRTDLDGDLAVVVRDHALHVVTHH